MWFRLRRDVTELTIPPGARFPFPEEFLFGAASASHQVDGGDIHSDWWRFEREPGRVQCFAEFSETARNQKSDHWRQFRSDVERMQELGLTSYRFSIDWSRVEPEEGRFDQAVLDQYTENCRTMRAAGIRPCVTLFHWSSPDWIWDHSRQTETGWYAPNIVQRFERFVQKVVTAISPHVDLYITLNEPNIFLYGGYAEGILCPGHQQPDGKLFPVLRNLLNAHVAAARVIRGISPQSEIGIAHHFCCFEPLAKWNPVQSVLAAMAEYGFSWNVPDAFRRGVLRLITRSGRFLTERIPELVGSVDFLGMNYYERWHCRRGPAGSGQVVDVVHPHREEKSIWPLEINSRRFIDMLRRAYRRYRLPIHVTENGCSHPDDEFRNRFLQQHLIALSLATRKHRVDVRGYYYWSLLDNQEWANGFATRMGLYAVDYDTGERTLRPVGRHYAQAIKDRAILSTAGGRQPELSPVAAAEWER